MRARSIGIILDALSLGIVCVLLAILASEMPDTWRLLAVGALLLMALIILLGWSHYRQITRQQAIDCRYRAMVDRIQLTAREPWPRTPQLLDRHIFGGQTLKK